MINSHIRSKNRKFIAFYARFCAFWILFASIFISNHAYAVVKSSIVINSETGLVLEANNADAITYPASLTKLMTMYIVFEAVSRGALDVDQELTVSKNAASKPASKLYLSEGETITVKEAVLAMATKSANDAATVVAEAIGGTEEKFAEMMTDVAHQIGMTNTVFKNASGLHEKGQVTTARDMAMLGMAVIHHYPQYYYVFSTNKFYHKDKVYYNHNNIMKSYDGADGLKTGFTYASGYNLMTSAKRNNTRLIGVVLGASSEYSRRKRMAGLLDTAFAEYGIVKPRKMKEKTHLVYASRKRIEEMSMSDELKEAHKRFGRLQNIIGNVAAKKLANMKLPAKNPFKEQQKLAQERDSLTSNEILEASKMGDISPAAGGNAKAESPKFSVAEANINQNKNRYKGIKKITASDAGLKPIPVLAVAKKVIGNDNWAVQLGSCLDYRNAVKIVQRLSVKYDFIRGQDIHISEVNVADMSMFRSRISGLSKKQAEQTCSYLKSKDEACYVVPPGEKVASLPAISSSN
jgi:D-alanyl-D-alanine carboxypeptidase